MSPRITDHDRATDRAMVDAAMATARQSHRLAASERLVAAEAEARLAMVGQVFRYRGEMLVFLSEHRKQLLDRSLSASESAMVQAVTIGLWGEYARLNSLDVLLIHEVQYTQRRRTA